MRVLGHPLGHAPELARGTRGFVAGTVHARQRGVAELVGRARQGAGALLDLFERTTRGVQAARGLPQAVRRGRCTVAGLLQHLQCGACVLRQRGHGGQGRIQAQAHSGIQPLAKLRDLPGGAADVVQRQAEALLVFVTKQAVDAQSGLEGYYFEYDRDLEPHERLRFARDEDAPDFDSSKAPLLPTTDWPVMRLAKAHRNYAMEYVRSAMVASVNLFGPAEAGHILRMTGYMVGMQFYHEIARDLGFEPNQDTEQFARFVVALCQAQGDEAVWRLDGRNAWIDQETWGIMKGIPTDLKTDNAWQGLLTGMLSAHHHRLALAQTLHKDKRTSGWTWKISHPG